MRTTDRPTQPCLADQQAPLTPGRSTLADVALSQGVSAEHVSAYLAHRSAYLSQPYAFVQTVIGLQAVPS